MQTLTAVSELVTGAVRDAMTHDVQSALADEPVYNVAVQMAKNHLRRIVIVDHRNRVVGVVSQRDMLRHFLTQRRDLVMMGVRQLNSFASSDCYGSVNMAFTRPTLT